MPSTIRDLKTIVLSSILVCVVITQGAFGTIFPPPENSPPIPSQGVNHFRVQSSLNVNEDSPELRHQRFSESVRQTDEEGWYLQDRQSEERGASDSSFEEFDYERGEIGRVATPRPDIADETYQPSAIYRLDPRDFQNAPNPEIYILARNSEGRYNTGRWAQIPDGRLVEGLNPVAADTVKSFSAPVSFDVPPENPPPLNPGKNTVQIRPFNTVVPQKIFSNSPTIVENVPLVKQTGIPPLPASIIRKSDQQRILNIPPVGFSPPAIDQVSIKQSFAAPPPPPPALKGAGVPSKLTSSIPVNIAPDSNLLFSNKNAVIESNIVPGKNIVQQVRHVWIPTSVNTGKFITIPISGTITPEKSVVNKEFSLESTPITVSDTWVLKQDGSAPVFEQHKSPLPPVTSPIVQSGKVIFQNPTVVQVDAPKNPIVTTIESPKGAPLVEKSVISNNARNIWPVRKEVSAKVLSNYPPVIASDVPVADGKSDTLLIEKPVSEYITSPQKSIITERKSVFPPKISSPNVRIVNGKPCPLPLPVNQKTSFFPSNPTVISIPRIVSAQRSLPFARIIKVNRYPTGSYYLINRNVRPTYLIYPSQAAVQQPKTGTIRIIPSNQLPAYIQRKIPIPPVQRNQISIAVQSKQFAPSASAKQATYPFVPRQVILPAPVPKSTGINFPTVQAIRYAYPWNAYLKSSPVINNGAYIPEFSPFKIESESSSSESSSSEESSESSKEKKKEKSKKEKDKKEEEKSKKEKDKKEEKGKSEENSNSKESEKESKSNSKSKEKESEEKSSEKESEERSDISER